MHLVLGPESSKSLRSLPECKAKSFYSPFGEPYLEIPVDYPLLLAHQLVRPLTGGDPVALRIRVRAVRRAGRVAVDSNCEPDWLCSRRNAHDEIYVAGVEAERDLAVRLIQY